jgi:hypothetical protein
MKNCSNVKCNQINPQASNAYYKSKRAKDGLQSICKYCQCEKTKQWFMKNKEYVATKRKERWEKSDKAFETQKAKEWGQKNPNKLRHYNLKRKYGISLEDYKLILGQQNGVCKICKKPEIAIDSKNFKLRDLAVDHCHVSNKVRGLLCTNCNQGLGCFMDNIDYLKIAIKYLEES